MDSTTFFAGKKFTLHEIQEVQDALTVEEILNISVNDKPYTMTMRTPGDEEALTRGILLSEQVYDHQEEHPVFSIVEKNDKNLITKVNVQIPFHQLKEGINTQRNLIAVSSCGMCGKNEMELAMEGDLIKPKHPLSIQLIGQMFQTMSLHQHTFKDSGGSHAAAAFTIDGKLLSVKEDIGRHNAVDKVIGSLLMNQTLKEAQCLLISGRVSYEIVSKCFRAQIPFLAAVSAPSSMAIEYCIKTGITLIAFCRQDKCTVYTHQENIVA